MFRRSEAITPDDNNDLERNSQAIFVGSSGNIAVHMVSEDVDTPVVTIFHNVQQGTILPIWVRRVLSTGTTASNLVSLRS